MKKVVIIGSGIIGSAIAYELSKNPQLNITLIDEKEAGTGATGAALGILMGIISLKTKGRGWKLREESLQRYKTLIPELEGLTGITIPHNRDGIVKLLFSEDEIIKYQKLGEKRAEQGYNLSIWDSTVLGHYCPEVNTDGIMGGVYSPDDIQIHPTQLTKALVKGATIQGVNCLFGEKVEYVSFRDNEATAEIHLKHQSLVTDWLIIASGLGTSNLIRDLGSTIEIKPVLGQALLIKHQQWKTYDDFNPVITGNDIHIAPMGNDEFWLGATVEFPDNQGDVIPQAELLKSLHQNAVTFCPSIATAPIMLSWTGKRPRPEGKSAPVIETLESHPNIILATGHYRNGILLAPATALSVKQLLNHRN